MVNDTATGLKKWCEDKDVELFERPKCAADAGIATEVALREAMVVALEEFGASSSTKLTYPARDDLGKLIAALKEKP